MAGISGKDGTVDGSGTDIKSWSIDVTTELLDSTSMGSNCFMEFIAGLQGATGSLVSNSRFSGGATIHLANASNSYTGSVLFSSEAVETPVDGLVAYTHSFSFVGSITVT